MTVSALEETTLAALRAVAAKHASRFVDPVLVRAAEEVLPAVSLAWLEYVTGRRVPSWQYLTNEELALAVAAAEADAGHLKALADERVAAAREESRRRAEAYAETARQAWETWAAIRARLPVPVTVNHNWTARHLDGYEQGGNHIVVLADLNVGRLHRKARYPLCWTSSRAHQLRYVDGGVGDDNRLPDCKTCLKHARRLASASTTAAGTDRSN